MSRKSGTRIRYEKTSKDGVLQSVKVFTSNVHGGKYRVYLDINLHKFRVKNINSRHYVAEGESKSGNLNVLKRNVKKALQKLGVEFEKELARDNSGRIPGVNCSYGGKNENES